MADLGITDAEKGKRDFEKAFRTTADEAAEIILRGVQKNKRRILVGTDAKVIDLMQRIFPGSYQGFLAGMFIRTAKRMASR